MPPTQIIVTRHSGAAEWIRRQVRAPITATLAHIDSAAWHRLGRWAMVGPVKVFGVLPLHGLLRLQALGVQCWAFDVELPAHRRGFELSADELIALGARLIRVSALCIDVWPPENPDENGHCGRHAWPILKRKPSLG